MEASRRRLLSQIQIKSLHPGYVLLLRALLLHRLRLGLPNTLLLAERVARELTKGASTCYATSSGGGACVMNAGRRAVSQADLGWDKPRPGGDRQHTRFPSGPKGCR